MTGPHSDKTSRSSHLGRHAEHGCFGCHQALASQAADWRGYSPAPTRRTPLSLAPTKSHLTHAAFQRGHRHRETAHGQRTPPPQPHGPLALGAGDPIAQAGPASTLAPMLWARHGRNTQRLPCISFPWGTRSNASTSGRRCGPWLLTGANPTSPRYDLCTPTRRRRGYGRLPNRGRGRLLRLGLDERPVTTQIAQGTALVESCSHMLWQHTRRSSPLLRAFVGAVYEDASICQTLLSLPSSPLSSTAVSRASSLVFTRYQR